VQQAVGPALNIWASMPGMCMCTYAAPEVVAAGATLDGCRA
jgi:hypothetical protein